MFGWAEICHSRIRTAKVFSLLTQEGELTCEAVVGGSITRILTDTGGVGLWVSSVSFMKEERYRILRNWRWLRRPDIYVGRWKTNEDKGNGEDPRENRRDKEYP